MTWEAVSALAGADTLIVAVAAIAAVAQIRHLARRQSAHRDPAHLRDLQQRGEWQRRGTISLVETLRLPLDRKRWIYENGDLSLG